MSVKIAALVGKHFGAIQGSTTAEMRQEIDRYAGILAAAAGNPYSGKKLFAANCGKCHTLFGEGGQVGPDITGANRGSLDYLLENVLDPSAVIPKEYAVTRLTLTSGRVVMGIVKGETAAALTVVTANETLTVPRGEVESREPSDVSMMPDDLLKPLSDAEVRALFAYLQSPKQVPLPPGAKP